MEEERKAAAEARERAKQQQREAASQLAEARKEEAARLSVRIEQRLQVAADRRSAHLPAAEPCPRCSRLWRS